MDDDLTTWFTGVSAVIALLAAVIAVAAYIASRRTTRTANHSQALALHRELTCLEAQRANEAVFTDPASKSYLLALLARADTTTEMLGWYDELRGSVRDLVDQEIENLRMIDTTTKQTVEGDQLADPPARLGADRSTYAWDGMGRLTKHQVLQRVAQQWALDNQLTSVTTFAAAFGAEVARRLQVPRSSVADGALLAELSQADRHHRRVAEMVGPLVLDQKEWVVRYTVGRSAGDYAKRTQLPLIDSFVADRYHVSASSKSQA